MAMLGNQVVIDPWFFLAKKKLKLQDSNSLVRTSFSCTNASSVGKSQGKGDGLMLMLQNIWDKILKTWADS